MILSYVFDPQHTNPETEESDSSFLAAGLASLLIHPLWVFVVSAPPPKNAPPMKPKCFRDRFVKGASFCMCALSLVCVYAVSQ